MTSKFANSPSEENSKNDSEGEFNLIPAALAVNALRDSGYRNTTYALAELVDNSIQAGASRVEVLCCERRIIGKKANRNIHQIGVLDNGKGMNAHELRIALQFGNGNYLTDRSGIGRFGMGLPSSSISQCRKVEVWTWQGDRSSPLYSYISIDEVTNGTLSTIPAPIISSIPKIWRHVAKTLGASGTLVVWSNLDRCMWKTARAILKHSEYAIGRMYRRFIREDKVKIRLASFVEDVSEAANKDNIDKFVNVNDPIYLMVPSSTPEPYNSSAMFEKHGDKWTVKNTILHNNEKHEIIIRFTLAKYEVRNRINPGSTPFGKHAKDNVGVSLLRADRELELETSLVGQSEPRDRWWGVELEFPPSLDEIFGVTNNKQSARNFTDVASEIEKILSENDKLGDLHEIFNEDEDPREPLVQIIHLIKRRISQMRSLLRAQSKGQYRKKPDQNGPERTATDITRERQRQGYQGTSDKEEILSSQERERDLEEALIDSGRSPSDSKMLAAKTISSDIKYIFTHENLDGSNFFAVKPVAGEILIKLNTGHPAYENLVEVLEDETITYSEAENGSKDASLARDKLQDRLNKANQGLKLLLMAWARFEDESDPPAKKQTIQDIRYQWGQFAALFLRDDQ